MFSVKINRLYQDAVRDTYTTTFEVVFTGVNFSRFGLGDDFYISQDLFSDDDEVDEYIRYKITTTKTPEGSSLYNILRLGHPPIGSNNLRFVASFTDSACKVSQIYPGYHHVKRNYTVMISDAKLSFGGVTYDDEILASDADVSFLNDNAPEVLKAGIFMLSLACQGLYKRYAETHDGRSGDNEDTNMADPDKISEGMKDLVVIGAEEGGVTKVSPEAL